VRARARASTLQMLVVCCIVLPNTQNLEYYSKHLSNDNISSKIPPRSLMQQHQ
jgi:hypothetical protein